MWLRLHCDLINTNWENRIQRSKNAFVGGQYMTLKNLTGNNDRIQCFIVIALYHDTMIKT